MIRHEQGNRRSGHIDVTPALIVPASFDTSKDACVTCIRKVAGERAQPIRNSRIGYLHAGHAAPRKRVAKCSCCGSSAAAVAEICGVRFTPRKLPGLSLTGGHQKFNSDIDLWPSGWRMPRALVEHRDESFSSKFSASDRGRCRAPGRLRKVTSAAADRSRFSCVSFRFDLE